MIMFVFFHLHFITIFLQNINWHQVMTGADFGVLQSGNTKIYDTWEIKSIIFELSIKKWLKPCEWSLIESSVPITIQFIWFYFPPVTISSPWIHTVYPKKYAHGFVVLCFVVVMQSFIMNSHVFTIHKYSSIFIRVALLALGQSLDCHSASEVSLMDMGKPVNV